jgi:hypothetical protein
MGASHFRSPEPALVGFQLSASRFGVGYALHNILFIAGFSRLFIPAFAYAPPGRHTPCAAARHPAAPKQIRRKNSDESETLLEDRCLIAKRYAVLSLFDKPADRNSNPAKAFWLGYEPRAQRPLTGQFHRRRLLLVACRHDKHRMPPEALPGMAGEAWLGKMDSAVHKNRPGGV